jgi:hypothetical protein
MLETLRGLPKSAGDFSVDRDNRLGISVPRGQLGEDKHLDVIFLGC